VKKHIACMVWLALMAFMAGGAGASEIIYRPINPSFGGDPNNGPFLLNEAQAQNTFKDPPAAQKTALQQFNDQLNNEILYGLASKLTTAAFGEGSGIQAGHYQMGNFSVDISKSSGGLSVNILDTSTGNTTTVQIPYY
jgi:curli production assembly/transport component CsgF